MSTSSSRQLAAFLALTLTAFTASAQGLGTPISDEDLAITGSTGGNEIVLAATSDATLYEGDGSIANGSGSYFFTGATASQNGSAERRALLAFEIDGMIPLGSTITEVTLELNMSRTISGNQTVDLHRVLESWGEGPSDPTGEEGGGAAVKIRPGLLSRLAPVLIQIRVSIN